MKKGGLCTQTLNVRTQHIYMNIQNGDEMVQVIPFGKPDHIQNIFSNHLQSM